MAHDDDYDYGGGTCFTHVQDDPLVEERQIIALDRDEMLGRSMFSVCTCSTSGWRTTVFIYFPTKANTGAHFSLLDSTFILPPTPEIRDGVF